MARFWKNSWDWCHVCGTRQDTNVFICYPSNAEHQICSDGDEGSADDIGKTLRICADCGETIVRIGRGELEEDVRNNPALVTRNITNIGPYFRPEFN